jgi:hypothetical protein
VVGLVTPALETYRPLLESIAIEPAEIPSR